MVWSEMNKSLSVISTLREVEGCDLTIPPFAKNAKDGAPVDWWRG